MTIKAAGCLVFRKNNADNIEVLLVHRPKYQDWSFPKGKIDYDESPEVCACREVAEETKCYVALKGMIEKVVYKNKSVYYYLATVVNDEVDFIKCRFPVKYASNKEIDEVKWFELSKAIESLTYRLDIQLLTKYSNMLNDYDVNTPVLLPIKYQKKDFNKLIVKKMFWHGKKENRPLSSRGYKEMFFITQKLLAYGIKRIIIDKDRRFYRQLFSEYCKLVDAKLEIVKNFDPDNYKFDVDTAYLQID